MYFTVVSIGGMLVGPHVIDDAVLESRVEKLVSHDVRINECLVLAIVVSVLVVDLAEIKPL